MDFPESTKVVLSRIRQLEPENATKIIGYVLLQDISEREMIRLSFGPESLIQALINKAKLAISKPTIPTPIHPPSMNLTTELDLPTQFTPYSPASSRSFWDQPQIHNMDYIPQIYTESIADDYGLHNQAPFLNLDESIDSVNHRGVDFAGNYCYPDGAVGGLAGRVSRRSPSLPEFPVKVCHYYLKGFCKHGTNCRYWHGPIPPDSFSQFLCQNGSEFGNEDHMFLPGSLEKLELELTELLKSRRGHPVSIAALPLLYYEKYGRSLQADGYLTESQRHGKAGYSLTKLLARLKNSIRLIDRFDHELSPRPHGQHAVILAEDAPRYMEFRNERNDHGSVVSGSRQIYLTFPAESTFTEEDVSNYFKSYGQVQDVRIPCQQKRMFGFVTFLYADTVKMILNKGNPHFVCGARVLVKPYREKSRLSDRRYAEKYETPMCFPSSFLEMEHELQSMPRFIEQARLLRKQQLIDEQEEYEMRRLSEIQLASKPLTNSPYFGYSLDEFKPSEDHNEFTSTVDHFSYLFDVLNIGSSSDDRARNSNTNYNDADSTQGLNLPESPFASSMAAASSISTVI